MSEQTPPTQAAPEVANESQIIEQPQTVQEAEKPEVDYSTRFAALTRKERELQQREHKYKKELEDLRGKLNPYEEFQNKKSLARENPEILDELLSKHLGLSFEDILDLKVSAGNMEKKEKTPQEVYDEIMSKLENDKNAVKELELKKQTEYDEKLISEFRNKIEVHAKQEASKYELLNHIGDYDSIFALIEQHHENTGEIMEISEACAALESHYEQLVEGIVKFNKIKSKFGPAKQEVIAEPKTEAQSSNKFGAKVNAPKTLSNLMQSQSLSSVDASKSFDVEESKKRAAALIKWT